MQLSRTYPAEQQRLRSIASGKLFCDGKEEQKKQSRRVEQEKRTMRMLFLFREIS